MEIDSIKYHTSLKSKKKNKEEKNEQNTFLHGEMRLRFPVAIQRKYVRALTI